MGDVMAGQLSLVRHWKIDYRWELNIIWKINFAYFSLSFYLIFAFLFICMCSVHSYCCSSVYNIEKMDEKKRERTKC